MRHLATLLLALSTLLFSTRTARAQDVTNPDNGPTSFGPVRASGLSWTHLSTAHSDLPLPGPSPQQTGAVVADLDQDGVNDFVLSFRNKAPALVWYRRTPSGWDRHVIEKELLPLEAGGAVADIDSDGHPDIVFGGDFRSPNLYWWQNPGPHFSPSVSWKRYTIKTTGANQHHDQAFADFLGAGKPQLAFWNQKAKKIFLAPIPPNPTQVTNWPLTEIFSGESQTKGAAYPEGMAVADIDGDGAPDLIAGNHWFKHTGSNSFKAIQFADYGGRVAAGKFDESARLPRIVVNSGDGVGPLMLYTCTGNPENSSAWSARKLLDTVTHGHSLAVADIDADGHLDVFAAEMAKWKEKNPQSDHPDAKSWIFFGDGKGNFRPTVFSVGIDFHEARVADLDGDGSIDILDKPYNWQAPRIDVWLQRRPKR